MLAVSQGACPPKLLEKGGAFDLSPILDRIDRTTTNLSTDTTRWVAELSSLANDLANDKFTQAATYVRDTLQNGIAAIGIEVRCDADFTIRRIKRGLQSLKNAIVGSGKDASTTTQFPPFVCGATPNRIAWQEAPQSISLVGYDFHLDGMSMVVVATSGGLNDVSSALTQPSPYQVVLNLSSAGAAFPRSCARIEIRWQGTTISSLPCLVDCPAAPPPTIIEADTRVVLDDTRTCGDSALTGCRADWNAGQACPNGYFRNEPFDNSFVAGKGSGNCGEGDQNVFGSTFSTTWQSANKSDCSIHEHVGLGGGTFGGFHTCRFMVSATRPRQVITHPAPQVGWCR